MLSFIALLRIQRKEKMDAISSFASLYYLMDLLVQSLVVVPIVGTVASLMVMVSEFRHHAKFKPARYAVDNVGMTRSSACCAMSTTERTPTPAELAAIAIAEAAETSVLVGGRVRTAS